MNTADRIFGVALLATFGAAIAYLHFGMEVSFRMFILGSGSWGFGCILKLILYQGFIRKLSHEGTALLRVSILNGLVSGLTELGVALAFFVFLKALTLPDVVAFGLGIGAIEAVLVATPSHPLKGTGLEGPVEQLEAAVSRLEGGRKLLYAYGLPFAERILATGIHIGTRGLVYISWRSTNPLPFAAALLAFVLADGILGYRLLHQGRLSDLRVLNRTYISLAGIATLVLAGFFYGWSE